MTPLDCIIEAGYEQPICSARIRRGGPEELLQLQHCTRIVHVRNTNDVSGHHNDVQLLSIHQFKMV